MIKISFQIYGEKVETKQSMRVYFYLLCNQSITIFEFVECKEEMDQSFQLSCSCPAVFRDLKDSL